MGGAFVFAGLRNIQNRAVVTEIMKARGVRRAGAVFLLGVGVQAAAGLSLAAGIRTAEMAAVLLLFVIAATVMFHNFWDYQGQDRASRINSLVGNVAITGGLIVLIAGAMERP
nr:DoxX family protein [Rhizobium lusitanum]